MLQSPVTPASVPMRPERLGSPGQMRSAQVGTQRLGQWVIVMGLALVAVSPSNEATRAQGVTPEETVRSVRRMLERLPYYGVFDYLVFSVDKGVVGLGGYSFDGRLKADAEMAVRRVSGVREVANRIEVLPASENDDRIRWATYYRIYTDDFLSRYSPGGVVNVFRELKD